MRPGFPVCGILAEWGFKILGRLQTGVLEGMNDRIKVIQRMAYGYRDTEYFFLRSRAAFPGEER